MIDPKVYLKAAKLIHKGARGYCCNAINEVSFNINTPCDLFIEYFKPEETDPSSSWFGLDKDNRAERITALLLMAEIAKDLK